MSGGPGRLHPAGRCMSMDGSRRRELIERVDNAGLDHLAVGDHVGVLQRLRRRRPARRRRHPHGLRPAVGQHGGVPAAAAPPGRRRPSARRPRPRWRRAGSCSASESAARIGTRCRAAASIQRREVARMDEAIQIVRQLLTGRPLDFDGAHFSAAAGADHPATAQPIPIVVGGRSDAAIRRAGRLGDGWFGIWVSPSRYAASLETMKQAAADSGRAEPSWLNALNVWIGVDDDADAARRARGAGDGGVLRAALRAVRAVEPDRHATDDRRVPRPVRRGRVPRVQPDHQRAQSGARDRRRGGDPPAHRRRH